MNILHIINNLGSGGAEKLLESLLPQLIKEDGVHVEVLLLTAKGSFYEEQLKDRGIPITAIEMGTIYHPLHIYHMKRFIQKGTYDIVHTHIFPTQYWGGVVGHLLKNLHSKFVTTEHSTFNKRRTRRMFHPIESFIYSGYDGVVAINDNTWLNLKSWLGDKVTQNLQVAVIENGVDLERFRDAQPIPLDEVIPTLPLTSRTICMVGRFVEAKDHETLIEAMRFMDSTVHLILLGEGVREPIVKTLVHELELENRVHFLGFRQDVHRIMKSVDLVVLSSHWEGFGLAAVEGMAAGKAVVATDIEGLADVVRHAGVLTPPRDPRHLATTITELLTNTTYRQHVQQQCEQRANDFSIERNAQEHLAFYRKVLQR